MAAPVDAIAVLELIEAWLDVKTAERGRAASEFLTPSAERRLGIRCTVAAIRRGDASVPLGAPTHESGWLDPAVFADRLAARTDMPEEELWELSSALYRLPPDPAARVAAWGRIAPLRGRFGRVAGLLLTAGLGPDADADRAARELASCFSQSVSVVRKAASRVNRALNAVRQLIAPGTEPLPEHGDEELLRLRLLTSALRCRFGMSDVELLRSGEVSTLGSAALLARPWDPEEARRDGRGAHWAHNMELSQLSEVLPELACHAAVWMQTEAPVFAFPPVAAAQAQYALMHEPMYGLGVSAGTASRLLQRPDCPLRPLLRDLIEAIPRHKDGAPAAVEAFAVGLRDGRLRLHDLIEALVPGLRNKEAKPRALLNAMQLLAGQHPPFREAAAVAVERALAAGMEAVTPSDRVLALEALLAWRSEAGRAVEDPAARAALEALRDKSKTSRGGTLAKQLLDLPPRPGPTSAAHCLAADIRTMLCADVSPP
jgi:hypothetical protein